MVSAAKKATDAINNQTNAKFIEKRSAFRFTTWPRISAKTTSYLPIYLPIPLRRTYVLRTSSSTDEMVPKLRRPYTTIRCSKNVITNLSRKTS